MMKRKYKVIIAEDHVLLSQAIKSLVNSFTDFEVISICKNGKELITQLVGLADLPDIVLMDVNMPLMNGIEATVHINQNYPQIKVIALTVEAEEKTIVRMIRSGAKGYMLKDVDKEMLENALLEVMSSGYYYTQDVSNALMKNFKEEDTDTPKLKDREIEFLKFTCSEFTYKEIADKMFLSPRTIDGYRDSLFQKLGIKNRIGLALYAIKQGYFKVD